MVAHVGNQLLATGSVKSVVPPSQLLLATHLVAGNPLEPLATILEWKLLRRTRLMAVPKGNSARGLGNPQGENLSPLLVGYGSPSTTERVWVDDDGRPIRSWLIQSSPS